MCKPSSRQYGFQMGHAHWPLFDLRIAVDDLLLKPLVENDLSPLVDALSDDVELDPDSLVFDGQVTAVARGTITYQQYWRAMGTWTPDNWRLNFGVWRGDELLGAQEIEASKFSRLRTVDTASFLSSHHRGEGVGKAMRAGVLTLAFDYLGAELAITSAWHDNNASLGVSRALGYADNGMTRDWRATHADSMVHLQLTKASWDEKGPHRARVSGVGPCLPFFGLPRIREL